MTLAVMTRATLGHTGQTLTAGFGTVAMYGSVVGATLLRVCAGLWPAAAMTLYSISAVLWVAGFAGFALLYGRLLLRARAAKSL